MSEKPIIIVELEQTRQKALLLLAIDDEEALQIWRREYLGTSSAVMYVFSNIGQQSKELRPLVGQVANQVKQSLEFALEERAKLSKKQPYPINFKMKKLMLLYLEDQNPVGCIFRP